MTRRHFLQTTAATATLAASALNLRGDDKPKRPLKKAVNLGMANAKVSVVDKFKMIRDAGFDGIELNLPDDALTTDLILEGKKASGLEIAGIICTPHWEFPLSDPDPNRRERTVNGLKFALRQGGEIGCSRVLLVPGVVKKEVTYEQCWQRSIEGIKKCTDEAEKAKCHIAVENVWNQFINEPVAAARFVDEINHPFVGWHFDIGNCINFGWPEHWVRTLGKRIRNLHLKDYSRAKRDKGGPYAGFSVELGEGDAGWADVMKALDEVGYAGYGIAEVGGGDAARLKFLAERIDQLYAS